MPSATKERAPATVSASKPTARRPSRSAAARGPSPFAAGATALAGPGVKLTAPTAIKDPRLQIVLDKLDKSASRTKQHPPAGQKASEAQAAALPPPNERLAGAQAIQVDAMQEAPTKKAEPQSFLTLLRAEIQKVMPKSLGDTEKFMKGEKKDQLKAPLTGNISQQKAEASSGLQAASKQTPDPTRVPGKDVTALPAEAAAAAPPPIGAAAAMPAPKADAEVSLEKSKADANQSLVEARVTPEQLRKANDPRFSAVLTARSAVEKQADSAPTKYRTAEQMTLGQVAALAVADERKGLAALQAQRGKSGAAVKSRQQLAKEKDEAERKAVADHIEGIFNDTKKTVDAKLESLEKDVSTMFDRGLETALANMTRSIEARMSKWKLERYLLKPLGTALWLKDLALGLPDEVNVFYEEGRRLFTRELDAVVVNISKLVDIRLQEAKTAITDGQRKIGDFVRGLKPSLQAVGKAAEKEIGGRFDELRQGVDDKRDDLARNLAQRYKEAHDKADEKLKEMQAENKGLVTALKDKLAEVVAILRKFKERVMGMLKKGQETIDLIVADPIGFLGNLLSALKKGLSQFLDNIWTHLKAGFLAWLFGSLGDAGITLPKDFSLPSILSLVMQILGLTYDRLRAKAVKLIGERNVMLIEKAFELLKALWDSGPAALWEKMKEYLSNLKEMVVNAIQEWVVASVIKAAITKLATMFNPVGAIIQAILAIYNTVMFFIERINQILDFVEAVINSAFKIATGDLAAAANWIEQALARTIPLIIGFLARLLGLSGITDKIKSIIKKIQGTVDRAVDKVIEKIVGGIKKLFGAAKAAGGRVVEWWKKKAPFKTKGGESHEVFYSGDEKNAIPMVASKTAKPVSKKLDEFNTQASGAQASAEEKSGKARIATTQNAVKKDPNDPNLVVNMKQLFEIYEEGGSGKETKITRRTGSLGGDTVGLEMTADWLGANHKIGTPPKSNAQLKLMGLLVTDPSKSSDEKYIRGHLLNEHLGGEGDADNMFPITGNANSQHLHSTEKTIKEWVKHKTRWVKYQVKVQGISSKLDSGAKSPLNYVNSTFVCHAILKDAAGVVEEEFSTSIPSVFKQKQKAEALNIRSSQP